MRILREESEYGVSNYSIDWWGHSELRIMKSSVKQVLGGTRLSPKIFTCWEPSMGFPLPPSSSYTSHCVTHMLYHYYCCHFLSLFLFLSFAMRLLSTASCPHTYTIIRHCVVLCTNSTLYPSELCIFHFDIECTVLTLWLS